MTLRLPLTFLILSALLLHAAVPVLAQESLAGADKFAKLDRSAQVRLAGADADIRVEFVPNTDAGRQQMYLEWLKTAANAVRQYYGQFPVPRLLVRVKNTPGDEIGFSTTEFDGNQAVIEIPIGKRIARDALLKSWVATHEMVHLAFPMVPWPQRWAAEGQATYIEPIARLQIGDLKAEDMWRDLVEHLPNGLPRDRDDSLNGSSSIGRVYWGGALFYLLADIEIRQATHNKKGLQDALSAALKSGGNAASDWSIARAFKAADQGIGGDILQRRYDSMSDTSDAVDLHKLWQQLGIASEGGKLRFDDQAPLAALRRAIETGR